MNLFGPISSPASGETSSPAFRWALQRVKIVGNFAIVQGLVQIIGFGSGILIVRTLEQRQYAYYTIANTIQGTMNLLADIGISVGLISIGGRVWQDRHRFGQLINAALQLRKTFGAIAVIVVAPFAYFLLARNGASLFYSTILIVLVLAGLLVQLSLGVFTVVPRLRSDIKRIQQIDFTGAIARFFVLPRARLFFSQRRGRCRGRLSRIIFTVCDASQLCGAGNRSPRVTKPGGSTRNSTADKASRSKRDFLRAPGTHHRFSHQRFCPARDICR